KCGWAPVMNASANVPGFRAPSTWTSLFVRVRAASRRLVPSPSTSTSASRPTRARFLSSEIRSCRATSRSNLSWTTCLEIWSEQVAEERTAAGAGHGEVPPVGVDVLAEQADLHDATSGEPLHFREDVIHRPGSLRAAHEGDDAEGAPVVASHADGNPGVPAR